MHTAPDPHRIPVRAPYHPALTFTHAAGYDAFGAAQIQPVPRWRRAVQLGGAVGLIELEAEAADQASTITARLLASDGPVDPALLARTAEHIVDPDADWSGFYALAAGDPPLAHTADLLHGMRLLRFTSVFEALTATLIEQQIALSAAQRAERWLAETHGDRIACDGRIYTTLPPAERVARLTIEDLTPLKITFLRMGRLIDIARAQTSGDIDLEALPAQGIDALYRGLMALYGVGHWTAAWTICRVTGVFLYPGGADVALRMAMNRYYRGEKRHMSVPDMDDIFARYGSYDGLAAFFILQRYEFERHLIAP